MMTEPTTSLPPLQPAMVCQKCGAVNPPHAASCWVCDGKSANPYAAAPALKVLDGEAGPGQTYSRVELVFTFLLCALGLLAVLVGLGIAVQDPGMLVIYLIIAVPTFMAVGARALYSLAKGERPKATSLFMVFIWSAVITAALFCLAVVATFLALFVMCMQMLGGGR